MSLDVSGLFVSIQSDDWKPRRSTYSSALPSFESSMYQAGIIRWEKDRSIYSSALPSLGSSMYQADIIRWERDSWLVTDPLSLKSDASTVDCRREGQSITQREVVDLRKLEARRTKSDWCWFKLFFSNWERMLKKEGWSMVRSQRGKSDCKVV